MPSYPTPAGILAALFLVFLSVNLGAQHGSQIHFKNISVREGLSFPTITCMLQDTDGFVWVGTSVGLNRYDSRQFSIHYADPADSTKLLNDNITSLYEDGRQLLWVGTEEGVMVYDPSIAEFRTVLHRVLQYHQIKAISGTPDGMVWVLTDQHLVEINKELQVVSHFTIKQLAADTDIQELNTAAVDAAGRIWINTDEGLRQFDRATARLTDPLNDRMHRRYSAIDFYSSIYFDSVGRIWVSDRGNGLRYYDPVLQQWKPVDDLNSTYINGVVEDVDGRVWICTGRNGLNIYDPSIDSVEVIQYADQPESNFVSNSLSCIFSDRMNGIWIGTFNNGLQYYYQDQLRYRLYFPKGETTGINSNYITSFAVTADNDVWIGAGEEGLVFYDRGHGTFTKVVPHDTDPRGIGELKESFYIFSLQLTPEEDHLLIGTLTGFYDYDLVHQTWKYFPAFTVDTEVGRGSFVMSILQEGRWVYLTNYEHLQRYKPETGEVERYALPGQGTRIVGMAQRDSVIYLATRNSGLFMFNMNSGQITPIDLGENVPVPKRVRFMFLDARGRIILGSEDRGMIRYSIGLDEADTLGNLPAGAGIVGMTMCEDSSHQYWVATNRGLARVDSNWRVLNLFDQSEGFQPTYFTSNAMLYTPAGEVLVGGNTGLYSFDPDDFYGASPYHSRIHLTDFLLLNNSAVHSRTAGFRVRGELTTVQKIELPKYQNLITFEYTAIDFHNPARLRYAYRLEPYEGDWNEVNNRNYATYRDLPPGEYTFRVKYRVAGGEYAAEQAAVSLHLPPRPWLSGWAYLGYGLITSTLLWQFYVYRRNRRRMRDKLAMQEFQQEKMQELYDFKIEFFTQITHELRTPLTLIIGPLEEIISRRPESGSAGSGYDGKLLRIIHRNAHKLLHRVTQLLDFRKLENADMKVYGKKGDIVNFAEEVLYGFLELAERKNIELVFETNMERYPYVLFDKDIMEKILVNLVSNAVKFTERGTVCLEVREADDLPNPTHYQIRVSDTGRGIRPENLDLIFTTFFQEKRQDGKVGSGLGLKMVKQLTSLHRGTIAVSSAVDQGTEFLLSFPKADLELIDQVDQPTPERRDPPASPLVRASEPVYAPAESGDALPGEGKILVVDDEADVREVIGEILQSQYQVLTASCGERALEVARTEMPDLIVCDVMMPGMDGYAFCAQAKGEFLLGHIPIILLTALHSTEHEIEGLRTGADAYLTKPFSPNLLRARIENLLRSRRRLKQSFLNSSLVELAELSLNNADQEFIDRVIRYVDDRLDDTTLEVADISEALGMSASTFYRKLKSLTDLSGNEFVRTIRLKRSLELLKQGELNISEVGYRVGFSDPKYFSTCFKRLYQVTPTEFQGHLGDRSAL